MGLQLYQRYVLHDPRPAGLFFNPNFLGEFMSITSIVFFAFALFSREEKRVKFLYIVLFVFSLAAIVLTKSRGAAISCLAGSSVILFIRFRWKSILILLSLIIIFAVTPNPLKKRFISAGDVYRYSRLSIYDAGLRTVSHHPLGIGLGNFKYYYDQYELPIEGAVSLFGKKAKTLHNEHLQVLVEQGAVGAILYSGFIISMILKIMYPPRKISPLLKAMACGVGTSFLVHATVDSVYHTFALPLSVISIIGLYIGNSETSWCDVKLGKPAKVFLALFTAGMVSYATGTLGGFYLSSIGEKKAKNGKFIAALSLLDTASAADFLNGKTREVKGATHYRAFLETGDISHYRKAIEGIESSMRLQKRAGWLRGRKAILLLEGIKRGFYLKEEEKSIVEESLRLFYEQLIIEPHNVFAMKNLSILYRKLGRSREGERLLRKAISTEPNFAYGYYLLGKIKGAAGKEEEARFLYKVAFSIYKKYAGLKGLEKYAEKLVMLDDQALREIRGSDQ